MSHRLPQEQLNYSLADVVAAPSAEDLDRMRTIRPEILDKLAGKYKSIPKDQISKAYAERVEELLATGGPTHLKRFVPPLAERMTRTWCDMYGNAERPYT